MPVVCPEPGAIELWGRKYELDQYFCRPLAIR
jgi:hypothetical protein